MNAVASRYFCHAVKMRNSMPVPTRRLMMVGLFQAWDTPPQFRARRSMIMIVTMRKFPTMSSLRFLETEVFAGPVWLSG